MNELSEKPYTNKSNPAGDGDEEEGIDNFVNKLERLMAMRSQQYEERAEMERERDARRKKRLERRRREKEKAAMMLVPADAPEENAIKFESCSSSAPLTFEKSDELPGVVVTPTADILDLQKSSLYSDTIRVSEVIEGGAIREETAVPSVNGSFEGPLSLPLSTVTRREKEKAAMMLAPVDAPGEKGENTIKFESSSSSAPPTFDNSDELPGVVVTPTADILDLQKSSLYSDTIKASEVIKGSAIREETAVPSVNGSFEGPLSLPQSPSSVLAESSSDNILGVADEKIGVTTGQWA